MIDQNIQKTPNGAEKATVLLLPSVGQPLRVSVYNDFIMWYALPEEAKRKLEIDTQGDFAEKYHVNETTLSRWKDRPDFEPRVLEITRKWATGKTPDVVNGIYKAAVKGNPYSQQLWLTFMGLVKDKNSVEVAVKSKVQVTINDIRFIIRALPEHLQQKHYDNLRDLLIEADAHSNSERLEAGDRRGLTEDELCAQTDFIPQSILRKRYSQISNSNPQSVCETMEWDCDSSHHQSASWRWQE